MKILIDHEKCFQSGECYYNHPELFRMTESGAPELMPVDLTADPTGEVARHARQAAEVCPAAAISIDDA